MNKVYHKGGLKKYFELSLQKVLLQSEKQSQMVGIVGELRALIHCMYGAAALENSLTVLKRSKI